VKTLVAAALIAIVALLHIGFLVLEMFLWDKPLGRRVFRLTPEFSAASKVLAANQGLYNGFLAAGLLYSLVLTDGQRVSMLFLVFVIVAGVYGAFTVNRRVFWIQAAPAIVALLVLLIG
jgi:putative membrane protein